MSVKDRFFLERDKALLAVIDVQEKLCLAMDDKILRKLTRNIAILLETAQELGIPALVTEQYVKGLGATLPELKEKAAGADFFEKMAFSSCGSAEFMDKLAEHRPHPDHRHRHGDPRLRAADRDRAARRRLRGARGQGRRHEPQQAQLADRRRSHDPDRRGPHLHRIGLFQLLKVAGTEEFKKLSKLVR